MSKNSSETPSKLSKVTGPIFDKKHFNKNRLLASLGVVAAIVILLVVLPKSDSTDKTVKKEQVVVANISATVLKGDSKTKVARRVVSEYLASHTDVSLTSGQRLFMEENLRRTMAAVPLKVGESVEFKTETVTSLVTAAKALKATTLAKWEVYAKGIKF